MFVDFKVADLTAYHFSRVDSICREELHNGTIVSERDYVSNFTSKLRSLNYYGIRCHAQTINGSDEQAYGVDSLIVFQAGNEIKVGLFESKYPRFTMPNYKWDRLVDGESHFSNQIIRQKVWQDQLAVWEMFFHEAEVGYEDHPCDCYGSSCVWHDKASAFIEKRNLTHAPWTTPILKELLQDAHKDIYTIVKEILSCKVGKRLTISPQSSTCRITNKNDNNLVLDIPIPLEQDQQFSGRLESFLTETGIRNYAHILLPSEV